MVYATIKAPHKNGTMQVTGEVMELYVGQFQHKFLANKVANELLLTHFNSGMRVGSITRAKMADLNAIGSTDRAGAERVITRLVSKMGADKVNATLNNAPVLNQ